MPTRSSSNSVRTLAALCCFFCLSAFLWLIAPGQPVRVGAQGQATPATPSDGLPPAIVSFSSNLAAVSVAALESGAARMTLSWTVFGLRSEFRLQLDALMASDWVPLTDADLPPGAAAEITVQPSMDFGPPTYRLAVFNLDGQIVTQQIVTVPFETASLNVTPEIASFSATSAGVDFFALGQGQARVRVSWRVTNRLPTANLVFEQLLPDGSAISVELPRAVRWVASAGEGIVAPEPFDNNATNVRLRLRLVDLRDARVYDEAIIEVPITRGNEGSTPGGPPPPIVVTPGS
jgi:hypothetical protein